LAFVFFGSLLLWQTRGADFTVDYLEPKALTGTIYADAGLKHKLFTFRRAATNSGPVIHVEREFYLPSGAIAAREQVVYEDEQLKSFQMEDLQSGVKGGVVQSNGGAKMTINFSKGATKKNGTEKFLDENLISDMVGPYIVAHWDALTKGESVKCRLISVARAETVGFKFFKESDSNWHGKPVTLLTLEPTSIIVAQLVAPMHFVVEKNGLHRVLQYTGRTTPSIQINGQWQDFDAVTVFDWN
jgi:hypothetical protein